MHQNLVNLEAFDNEITGSGFGQKVSLVLYKSITGLYEI